jgi:hypothetical protein
MGPIDAFWHVLNFLLPGLAVAVVAASVSKLLWRRELATVPWYRLTLCAALAGVAALVVGLVVFGRDGKMATYGAVVLCAAAALWWAGFARR